LESEDSCTDLLIHCNIESTYQRNGIGTEMIKLAEEWYGNFSIVNHFSLEGADFMNFCLKNVFKNSHESIEDNRF